MPLSYRNIIDGEELKNLLLSRNDNGDPSLLKKQIKNNARYIRGYANQSALEGLANSLNINRGLFKQAFGLEDKKLDAYDPYHTGDAKDEEFWSKKINVPLGDSNFNIPLSVPLDGKYIQKTIDEDTSTFKRSLFSQLGYGDVDFFYEDPFIPSFELYFDTDSPFFSDSFSKTNSLLYFIDNYYIIDEIGYQSRYDIWKEFQNTFFKIFESKMRMGENRNLKNKTYYITKLEGVNNLNKKFIKYTPTTEAEKITITLNEDISMIAWYLAELYNNLVYSYKNQRFMFPENLLRFDMIIKINDLRNFTIPVKEKNTGKIYNEISKKSQIVYTLHDCNFDFFDSRNYGDSIEIGGYGASPNTTPQTLSFNIFFKSVTRWSEFPLQNPLQDPANTYTPGSIDGWEQNLSHGDTIEAKYSENISRTKDVSVPKGNSFANDLLGKATQTVVNQGLNYMDKLETKLREVRGSVVNNALQQLSNTVGINKIEPDNVYSPDFNNRISLTNLGRELASSLLNDFTDATRNAANF